MTVVQSMICEVVRRVDAVTRYRMAGESVAGCPMSVQSVCRKAMKIRRMTEGVRDTMSGKSAGAVKRRMKPANSSARMAGE